MHLVGGLEVIVSGRRLVAGQMPTGNHFPAPDWCTTTHDGYDNRTIFCLNSGWFKQIGLNVIWSCIEMHFMYHPLFSPQAFLGHMVIVVRHL